MLGLNLWSQWRKCEEPIFSYPPTNNKALLPPPTGVVSKEAW